MYIPHIDGLRAISAISIILYHADFFIFDHNILSGGFFGVDIFFVISGFLITNLILNELHKSNKFSINLFYERRARRILPALFFILIVSSIFFFIVLPYETYVKFFKSSISSVLFLSNFYFWITGQKYFEETNQNDNPLLHLWSISVEGQFYLIFPLFFIVLFKFYKKYLFVILSIFFLLSLFLTNYYFINYTYLNFFSSLSRIFEFLAGSLVSFFYLKYRTKICIGKPVLSSTFLWIGMSLILCSIFFFNKNEISHPSFITLFPIIGTMLVISFSTDGKLITKILSSNLLVFFGTISYSLYLWHYPVFFLLQRVEIFENTILTKLLAIILTIILSIFSYYFIEKPFRNKKIYPRNKLINYLFLSLIILLTLNFLFVKKLSNINKSLDYLNNIKVDSNKIINNQEGKFGNVVLIGDSHASSLQYKLNEELKENNFNLFNFTTIYYLQNFIIRERVSKNIANYDFVETNKRIDDFLNENENLIVVLHYRWSAKFLEKKFDNEEGHRDYDRKQDELYAEYLEPNYIKTSSIEERQKYLTEGITLSINNILKKGHRLILVYPVPELGFNALTLYTKYKRSYKYNIEHPTLSTNYDVYKKRNKKIFEILDNIHSPNIYRVYPEKYFCNTIVKNRCAANNKKDIFYYDTSHLSLKGSDFIVKDIISIIKKIN